LRETGVTFSDRQYGWFEDIVENITSIEDYTSTMSLAVFAKDRRTEDAVERCLSRITEAIIRLDNSKANLDQLFPAIRWAEARGLGNQLRHGYDGLNRETIWNIIVNDLPDLKKVAELVLSQE
jgi:uncharacterized protein with HEPN domain